jgi:hypothetical protein
LPSIPGLLEARRDANELRLTLANPQPQVDQIIASLGANSVDEIPLSLEEAIIANLGHRGEKATLLQSTHAEAVTS